MGVMASRPETLLVSTHDLAMVAEALPRTVIIDEGVVVADGPSSRAARGRAAAGGARAGAPVSLVPLRPEAATAAGCDLHPIDLPTEEVGREDAPGGILPE